MTPLTIAVVLGVVATSFAMEVPEYIHVCKRSDPDYAKCVSESIVHLTPLMAKGIPELNIPSVEPLILEELVAIQGNGLKISAKNIKAHGASDFSVGNFLINHDDHKFEADVTIPSLYVDGEYFVDGKLLLLPISGTGPFTGNFTNSVGRIIMQGAMKKDDNGEDCLYLTSFDVKIAISKGNMYLGNLFGGEPILSDVVNSAINNNFDIFLREMGPLVEKAISKNFLEISNDILERFTYNQLFPEN